MIHLHFSDRAEGLLGALATDIARLRATSAQGEWERVHLVLPNPGVKQFVLRELTKVFGVLANVESSYLEGFWRRFLPKGEGAIRLLDRNSLQGGLLGLLQDPATLDSAELQAVQGYLQEPARDMKTLQLAAELAGLFEGYLLTRPDWAPAWERGRAMAAGAPEGLEAWQRALWRRLKAKLNSSGEPWLTLPEYVRDGRFVLANFPSQVFVLGLGHVAAAHLEAFEKLGEHCDVRFYAFSPFREAWDDFAGEFNKLAEGDDPFGLEGRGNLALRRWGRPAREQVRLLMARAAWQCTEDFRPDFRPQDGTSLLDQLQQALLSPEAVPGESTASTRDASLSLHACPSPRREAEVVANLIWDCVLPGGGDFSFSDIAVVLPEGVKEEYLDALRLAFAGTRSIPWALAGEGPGPLRELAEVSLLLLQLGLGDANRAEVLRLTGHPAFRRRWAALPLEDLAGLCERCGIIARATREETAGTSLAGGLWTWERGLQRAAAGRFVGGGGHLDLPGEALPGAATTPAELDLLQLVQALLADTKTLAGRRQTPGAWARDVSAFLRGYLEPLGGHGDEDLVRALDSLVKTVTGLVELELPGLPAPLLGLREVKAVLDQGFQRLLGEALGQPGKGVVVACHAALRGIPFKLVILMALGEGVFPGPEASNSLDLRGGQRRAGDLSGLERDRTLFLEAVLAARERLVCTYVSRDPLTGGALQPSPLLLDLRDILAPRWGPEGWLRLCTRHPVYRHSLDYFPDLGGAGGLPNNHHPAARTEAEATWLGTRLRRAAGERTTLPGKIASWGLAKAAQAELEARSAWTGPLGTVRDFDALPDAPTTSLTALRKWLEDPLQGGALIRLDLRCEAERDPSQVAEEPFEGEFLDRRQISREVFWRVLTEGGEVAPALDAALHQTLEAGRMPVGAMLAGERLALAAQIEAWRSLSGGLPSTKVVRFGPDRSGRRSFHRVILADPVVLEIPLGARTVKVSLVGSTEAMGGGAAWLISDQEPPTSRKHPAIADRRSLLRVWIDQLILRAAGLEAPESVVILSARKDKRRKWRVRLPAVDQAGAQAQLTAWLQEALQDRRWAALPVEGILNLFDERAADGRFDLNAWADQARDDPRSSFAARYGPLPRAALASLETHWEELARRRFGDFPAWSRTWEEVL